MPEHPAAPVPGAPSSRRPSRTRPPSIPIASPSTPPKAAPAHHGSSASLHRRRSPLQKSPPSSRAPAHPSPLPPLFAHTRRTPPPSQSGSAPPRTVRPADTETETESNPDRPRSAGSTAPLADPPAPAPHHCAAENPACFLPVSPPSRPGTL